MSTTLITHTTHQGWPTTVDTRTPQEWSALYLAAADVALTAGDLDTHLSLCAKAYDVIEWPTY
jgi:hypothetical protein